MWMNLLAKTLPPGGKDVGIGTATLYALIGFLVVFVGIAFLIFVVWLVGKVLNKANGVDKAKASKKAETVVEAELAPSADPAENNEAVPEEVVAVIAAALTAYYQKNNPKCEFTVKRIKRI